MASLLPQNIQSLGYPADIALKGETPLIDIYADVASENTLDFIYFSMRLRGYAQSHIEKKLHLLVYRWCAASGCI